MSSFTCFVVRHAHAGRRGSVDDELRPLSPRGSEQAGGIAAQLAGEPIRAIWSSPFGRCVETVEPLGRTLGIPVATSDALAEGEGPAGALELLAGADGSIVICSHGDVIGDLLETLAGRGVTLDDDRLAKGSTWMLRIANGEVTRASYRPPPG